MVARLGTIANVALTCRFWCCITAHELDPAFAEKFLNFIIAEVIRHHETIAENSLTWGGASDS